MFATVECEATVFGFRRIRPEAAAGIPFVLSLPGADHVLEFLPSDRWALLTHVPRDEIVAHFDHAQLPVPRVIVISSTGAGDRSPGGSSGESSGESPGGSAQDLHVAFDSQHYVEAVAELGADPACSLSFEDSPDGVEAAKNAGLQVIGVAAISAPEELCSADLVVPSLLSVRVLGTHPFIVMEVDAIPDIGTGTARRR